jgi:O-antigen ligase
MDRPARLARIRRVTAFVLGLTILISTSASQVVALLAVALVLIERKPHEHWQEIRGNPVVWASLALFFWLGVSMAYSVAPRSEMFHVWLKYRELLLLPFFLLLCRDGQAARAGLYGFLASVALIVVLGIYERLFHTYIMFSDRTAAGVFGSYIIEGVMVSLAAYHLSVAAMLDPRRRLYWALGAGLAIVYVLFCTLGRTGYIVVFALALLLLFQTAPRRWLLPGLVIIGLVTGGIFLASPDVSERISGAIAGVEGSHANGSANSAGVRMQFYRGSLEVFALHPIFGTGTGSFERVYNAHAAAENLAPTTNPHNEYLMIGVQTGIVGLALLLALLGALWVSAARLPLADALRGRAVTLALAVSCLFNSSLLDHVDGQSFAFQIGLFYFGISRREDQRHHHDV